LEVIEIVGFGIRRQYQSGDKKKKNAPLAAKNEENENAPCY